MKDKVYYNFRFLERLFDSLFKVENLPETMDINFINWNLNRRGYITLLKANDGTLRCLQGAISGLDVYNRPVKFISTNPVPKYCDLKRTIGEDCVVMRNTLNKRLVQPNNLLFQKYAEQLANIETSIECAIYNSRVSTIFNVESDTEAQKIRAMFDQLAMGKPFIITNSRKPVDVLKQNVARPLIELTGANRNGYIVDLLLRDRWTIICNFLTEIGVNNNPFEKAERQITDEVNSNNEMLDIARFEYFKAREEAWNEFNEMFDENVTIEFNRDYLEVLQTQIMQAQAKGGVENVQTDV